MGKPKFKMSVEEMLTFQDTCIEAACNCPQYQGWEDTIDERSIFRKQIKPEDLVKRWLDSSTLWEYGYHEDLTEETLEIFEKYEDYKALKRLYKRGILK